jgi:hypothetical protein
MASRIEINLAENGAREFDIFRRREPFVFMRGFNATIGGENAREGVRLVWSRTECEAERIKFLAARALQGA